MNNKPFYLSMLHQALFLICLGWVLIPCLTEFHETQCQKSIVKKTPCIHGRQQIKATIFVKINGVCTPVTTSREVHCKRRRKNFCKCSVIGDGNYRSYDGQRIHFFGNCRYTLSKHDDNKRSCAFNIEISNKRRKDHQQYSYRRKIIIRMFGNVYELGPGNKLKVNDVRKYLPYDNNANVRIFRSYRMMQFVSRKCSVRVAFDGSSNAFVQVSKRYSRRMVGICGDCNGKQDDYKTRSGKNVSHRRNKFALIADSFRINKPGHKCQRAHHVTYKDICGSRFINKIAIKNTCKGLLAKHNPFSKCSRRGHVDLRSLYDDCVMDMCINQNKPKQLEKVRCRILAGLSELCAEAGFSGIKWRTVLKCPKRCGKNQHFTTRANPCPKTCENHFYGSKRPCYDLPEREGCECNKGFIRDGALCVKPEHCKCIDLCVDRKGSKNCAIWKARGNCRRFTEQMNILCAKTCGFCKSRGRHCENDISTRRCLRFRRIGLCFHEFYKSICGLTCNFDKCKCRRGYSVKLKCNKLAKIQTTIHYKFIRDSKNRCVKLVRETHKVCNCKKVSIILGRCNFCTGKRKVTQKTEIIVGKKCVTKKLIRYEDCARCPRNAYKRRECVAHTLLKIITHFQRLIGCYKCVPDRRIKTIVIRCKDTVIEKIDKKHKCLKHITIIRRRPINCRCNSRIIRKRRIICCPKDVVLPPICVRRKIVYRTRTCIPVWNSRGHIIKCRRKYKIKVHKPVCTIFIPYLKGKCYRLKFGKFYCKAIDTRTLVGVDRNCKCKYKVIRCARVCCCKRSRKYKVCDRRIGLLTYVHVKYRKIGSGCRTKCVKIERRRSKLIRVTQKDILIKGKCQKNCLRYNKLIRFYRDGCKIKNFTVSLRPRLCCCIPRTVTKRRCVRNSIVTYQFKRVVRNQRCVNILVHKEARRIRCPLFRIRMPFCIKGWKRVPRMVLKKCKCSIVYRRKRCRCRGKKHIKTKYVYCNRYTCVGTKILYFKYINCYIKQKICPYKCCCRRRPPPTSHCDTSTGRIIHTKIIKKYNLTTELCTSRKVSTATTPVCTKINKIKHSCNEERRFYRKVTIIKDVLSAQFCKCVSHTIIKWRPCCPPKPDVRKECFGDYIQTRTVDYKLTKYRCIPIETIVNSKIRCPRIPNCEGQIKISECKYEQYWLYYKIKNCKCIFKRKSVIKYSKCCEPSTKTVQCVNGNTILTTTTEFRVNDDRTKCIPYITSVSKVIKCQHAVVVRKTRCVNGVYYIIYKYFHVKNCKCRRARIVKIRKVCCPTVPKVKTTCIGKSWRTTTIVYTSINDDRCVESISFKDYPVRCAPAKIIVCPCDKKTRLRQIKRHYFTVRNCKCVPHQTITCLPCFSKKKNYIIRRKPCRPDGKQIVTVYGYTTRNDQCVWIPIIVYEDICRCPKGWSVTICFGNFIYRTTITRFQLRRIPSRYPTHRCVESKSVKDKLVKCPVDYSYTKRCRNRRKRTIRCSYERRKCRCELSCKVVRIRCCQCYKLNKCKIKCRKNVKYLVCHKYRCGQHRCIKTVVRRPIIERCPPRPSVRCLRQFIRSKCGIYQKCIKTVHRYIGCRCVPISRTKIILARCHKPIIRLRCHRNRWIRLTVNFYCLKKRKCLIKKKEVFVHTRCPRHSITMVEKPTYFEYTLKYFVKVNCICRQRTIVRRIYKCHVGQFRRRLIKKCKHDRWVYIQIHYQPVIIRSKLFPEVKNSLLRQICRKVVKVDIRFIRCCRMNYKVVRCNIKKNMKIVTYHNFVVENCRCVHKVRVVRSRPCRPCRRKIIRRTKCRPVSVNTIGYWKVTIISWHITIYNKCKRKVTVKLRICRCPRSREIEECRGGKRILKTIRYELRKNKCIKYVGHKVIESVFCYNGGKKNRWIVTRFERCRYPGEYTRKYLEKFVFNPRNCGCIKKRKVVKVDICCKPCRYFQKCKNNRIINVRICQYSRNLKCFNRIQKSVVIIHCMRPTTEVIGDCRGRVIRNRVTTYKNVNCKCVRSVHIVKQYRPRDIIKCVKNRLQVTTFDYELINRRCIMKPPRIYYDSVMCIMSITIKDKRINQCDFSRSYYAKRVVNCRCVNRLIKKEILHYKCCKQPKKSRHCLNHRIKVFTTIRFHLLNFRCYPVKTVRMRPVSCKHIQLVKRVKTGICTYKKIYYRIEYQNCKCYRKVFRVRKNLKLCCPKPYTVHKCRAKPGQKVTIYVTYKLKRRRCFKLKRKVIINICCNTPCQLIRGPCVKHTRTLQLFCHKRRGCRCVRKMIKQRNVCCGRKKHVIWKTVSKCDADKKGYRTIRYWTLKLNRRTNKCQATVIRIFYDICCNERSYIVRSCILNIYHKITKFTIYKDHIRNQCLTKQTERIFPMRHCRRKTILKIKVENISKPGWCKVTYLIKFPRNCKCQSVNKTDIEICDCEKAFPPYTKRFCKQNHIIVIERYRPKCSRKHVIWIKTSIFRPILHCNRIHKIRGKCFYARHLLAIKIRYITTIQYFVKNCRCLIRVIRRTVKHCKCRPSHRKVQCIKNRKVITTYSYFISKGRCHRRKDRLVIKIPCPTKPIISRSRCRHNKYVFSRTVFRLQNCQCRSRTYRRLCNCKCPRDSKIRRCSKNYVIYEITTKFVRIRCRCYIRQTVVTIVPICPRYIYKTVGKCLPHRRHWYKKIIHRFLYRNRRKCTCGVKGRVSYRICRCKSKPKHVKKCVSNLKVYETWNWAINKQRNRCDFTMISSIKRAVSCPPSSLTRKCNYKTERGREVHIFYKLHHCKCIRFKKVKSFACPCSPKSRLIKKGRCNRRNCIRIDIYRKMIAKKRSCRPFHYPVKKACCCLHKKLRICKYSFFNHINIWYHPLQRKCFKRIKRIEPIICSDKVTVKIGRCGKRGYKKIVYSKDFVRQCKCIPSVIKVDYCRCRCKHSWRKQKCDQLKKSLISIFTSYSLNGCKCIKRRSVRTIKINCPPSFSSKPVKVKKHKICYIKIIKTSYYLNSACKCVPYQVIIKKRCPCRRKYSLKIYCDKKKHTLIITKKKQYDTGTECKKECSVRRIPVICAGRWKLVGSTRCQPFGFFGIKTLIFKRYVNHDCTCKEQTKYRRCHCACSGPPSLTVCRGNVFHHFYYAYKISRCRCLQIIIRRSISVVKCRKRRPIIKKCRREGNRCVRYIIHQVSYIHNCKCFYKSKVVREGCTNCVCPSSTTRTCNRKTNEIIIRKTDCKVLSDGFIRYFVYQNKEKVPCSKSSSYRPISKCDEKTSIQYIEFTFHRLSNCVCVKETKVSPQPCRCLPEKRIVGPCNKQTLIREIRITRYQLVTLTCGNRTCERQKDEVITEICDCPPNPPDRVECRDNRLIRTQQSCTFDSEKKVANWVTRTFDETPSCLPAYEKDIGQCDSARGFFTKTVRTKNLVSCQCQSNVQVTNIKCCNRQDYSETNCVDNKLVTTSHRFAQVDENCVKVTTKSEEVKTCLENKIEYLKIDPVSGTRIIRETSYRLVNCECIKKVTDTVQTCCCPANREYTKCIPGEGVIRTFYETNTLIEHNCTCSSNTRTVDKEINCMTTPSRVVNKCSYPYDGATYDVVTTTSERNVDCECQCSSSVTYELCNCPPPSSSISCENNKNVKKIVYYQAVKNSNGPYDKRCERKEKSTVEPDLVCPEESRSVISCGCGERKIAIKKYSLVNCECKESITIVTESGCVTRNCYEVPNDSNCSKYLISGQCDEDTKAMCPMTCGVCEKCLADKKGCEYNKYDNGSEMYARIKQ